MTSSAMYKRISHILLISPFICPILLSFQYIKVVWPMMATAGVCELCSLFAIFQPKSDDFFHDHNFGLKANLNYSYQWPVKFIGKRMFELTKELWKMFDSFRKEVTV